MSTSISHATTAPERASELEALYRARKDSAAQAFTEADVRFMKGMLVHHAQALIMCDLAPKNGASPSVVTLCSRIMNAQADEIKTMQRWLGDRGQTVPVVHIDGLNLRVDGVPEHMMHMPGMLTQDQLVELAAARGPDFDRLFLEGMIHHHTGAVNMVDELFEVPGAGQEELAFKLASDIHVDQITEIARMRGMLERITDDGRGE